MLTVTAERAEYGRRLARIQAEYAELSDAEDARHNAALARYRAEFRERVRALGSPGADS